MSAADLLDVAIPGSTVTLAGVRANVDVGIRYLHSWLLGTGAAAIHNLMEDVATAEISRAQLWQWRRHRRRARRRRRRSTTRCTTSCAPSCLRTLGEEVWGAAELLDELVLSDTFEEFLTLRAYTRLG